MKIPGNCGACEKNKLLLRKCEAGSGFSHGACNEPGSISAWLIDTLKNSEGKIMQIFEQILLFINNALGGAIHAGSSASSQLSSVMGIF